MALLLAHMAYYYPYTPDDTFISLRYAQRLVAGHGLTWNDGEYIEGYSNMLWVLLAAGLHYLGMDLLQAVQLMGAACALLTLVAFSYYARRFAVPLPALLMGVIVFALSAPVAIWGAGGLEMPMVMLLFAWVLVLSRTLIEDGDRAVAIKAGCLLGLICWLRPEGPVYTLAVAFGLFFSGVRLRTISFLCFTAFAFFCALLAFRLSYYGTWVPNTVLAKVAFSPARVGGGLIYTAKAMLSFLPVFLLIHYGAKQQARQPFTRFLQWVGIMLSLAIIIAGGDWLLGYRAFVPLVPIIILLVMESCRYVHHYVLVGCVLLAHTTIQFMDKDNLNAKMGQEWVRNVLKPIGEELRTRYGTKQPLIAVFTAGAIPYYSQLPTLDVYGLNDSYLTAHRHELKNFGLGTVGHDLFDIGYIESRKPDLLLFDIPGITAQCSLRPGECEKLYVNYEPFILETPGYDVKIWRRKDSIKVP